MDATKQPNKQDESLAVNKSKSSFGGVGSAAEIKSKSVNIIPESNEKKNSSETMKPGSTEFIGYGRIELQKYAKDPFWVKVRWILFILFWIVWFVLLIGAIVLVMASQGFTCKGTYNAKR
jgi:hypothetical protein